VFGWHYGDASALPVVAGGSLELTRDVVCDHEGIRQMWVAWRSGVPGTWIPGVSANCSCNEIAALKLRSLAPLPRPPDARLGPAALKVFRDLRRLATSYGGLRWSDLEVAESYSGSLRRRYLEAERSLRVDGPLNHSDVYLRAFLKADKWGAGKLSKPRLIFPRSPRYNLTLASWLKPLEHWLWGRLTARRLFRGSNTRVVAKGLNPRQRANLIVRKFRAIPDCVVFEADGKAFEAHVTRPQLEQEHAVYLSACAGDRELQRVLSRQLRLTGKTFGGVKFDREGGRASGDFNTGMGNTLIMLVVVVAALRTFGVRFDVLVDGDNALVFLSRGDADRVVGGFAPLCLDLSGHEMTLESPVTVLEKVRFGQSAPVFLGHRLGWTMVREPLKVLSGAGASHRWLRSERFGRRYLHGVARCELSLARGVPVLQRAFLELLRTPVSGKQVDADVYRDYFMIGAWLAGEDSVVEVSQEARVSYAVAFGVEPEEQLRVESELKGLGPLWPVQACEYPQPPAWTRADPGFYETFLDPHFW